ncbi:CotH kinase family protein [Oxobacter pfennigii]|nr:CotH kinase family protein [Oxobacter pfennigii]
MLDNAIDEEYISADITINGTIIKNVGIRPKGNSSLSSISRDETTDRYSFKIKFDEYVDGQTWMGLDKIVINSNFSDATSMKEYLSYDIMSYIGVNAPLFAYADISVNGEAWGFYLAVEDVDSGYLDRVYGGEGELYKPDNDNGMGGGQGLGMPGQNPQGGSPSSLNGESGGQAAPDTFQPRERDNMPGQGGGMRGMAQNGVSLEYTDDNVSSYSAIFENAETKTDENDHQRIITALKNLSDGTDLDTYVNVDAVLRYFAAHTVVVNLDSYISNMGHNYYLYENNGQISILPWDYNLAFGGFQSGNASDVVNFPIDNPVSGVSMENRPLLSKLLEVPEYLEKYHVYLQEILDGYFNNGKFEKKVEEINEMISDYIKNDPSAFYTYEEYQNAITELKKLGALRAESIQGQLDGTIPSMTNGQQADPDKLIDASSVNLTALGSQGGMGSRQNSGFSILDGVDMDTMRSAMEIIQSVKGGALTDERKKALYDLGLSDEQIAQMLGMAQREDTGQRGW